MNITKINKYNKETEQHFYNEDKKTSKCTHRLRYTSRTLLKLANTKNWTTKDQRINTQPLKTKVHLQIKIQLRNINKIEKYKKLNMMEHKTDMNIDKHKKQNMAGLKTDMNITKCKTDRDRAQNKYEHY